MKFPPLVLAGACAALTIAGAVWLADPRIALHLKSSDTREIFVLQKNDAVEIELPDEGKTEPLKDDAGYDHGFAVLESDKLIATPLCGTGSYKRLVFWRLRVFRLIKAGTTTISIPNKPYSIQPFTASFQIKERATTKSR